MLAVIDNYDSFTWNLVQILGDLGQEPRVYRNDAVTPEELRDAGTTCLVISPGPRTPSEAGVSIAAIRELGSEVPTLGVCLGHQAIGEAYGGRTIRAVRAVHGKTSQVVHDGDPLFEGIPSPMEVTRYHSLVTDPELPARWSPSHGARIRPMGERSRRCVTATTPSGACSSTPESWFTHHGRRLLANFLRVAGRTTRG